MCKIDNNHYNTAIRPKTVLFGDVIAIVEETPEVLIETIADHNGEPQEGKLVYSEYHKTLMFMKKRARTRGVFIRDTGFVKIIEN